MTGTALILGASGRFGHLAKAAFETAGWTVRSFDRSRDDLPTAARGADVIVNAWNPPYSRWQAEVPGLTRQVIAAAKDSGAAVLIPGNVYVFGPTMPPLLSAGTPHRAEHPLGRIRRELEGAYRDAGVRTLILRAGDFLDTRPSGGWFDKVITTKLAQGRLVSPGPSDLPHAWAYLPDMTATMATLAGRLDDLPRFADIPYGGLTLSLDQVAAHAATALGRPVTVKRMNWLPIQVARPFWAEAKYLLEMRYLWTTSHALDSAPLDALLPDRPKTDAATAVARAIAGLPQ